MAYQALYRVWRSQRFEDLVGQEMITQTLKQAIVQKKTSHAYLFTGPRGTGKTSAAKIFAKAINCQHSQDGEPCNECDTCKEITEGRLNDVIEIDAASNNGVEEIRDLREKVKYAPTQATYKVYIIDEVHMLSTGAFNALLKTLEEPPKNVLFILATTEPHKIPATIISRTQRFDFKRIQITDMVKHMAHILDESHIAYEEASLPVIARAAEGGMRDALSILDQGISFSQGVLTLDDAIQVTGSLTNDMMDNYLTCCQKQETSQALIVLHELLNEGKESSRLVEDLLLYCRDLLIYKQAPSLLETQIGTVTEVFKELASEMDSSSIYQYIDCLTTTQQDLRFSTYPTVQLEVLTVKLSQISVSKNHEMSQNSVVSAEEGSLLKQLQEQVKDLQAQVAELSASPSNVTTEKRKENRPAIHSAKQTTYRFPKDRILLILQQATKDHLLQMKDIWPDLLASLSVNHRAMLKAAEPVAASSEGLVIAFDYEILCYRANEDEELQQQIKTSLYRLLKYEPDLLCVPVDRWLPFRKEFILKHKDELLAQAEENEPVDIPEDVLTEAEKTTQEAVHFFGEAHVEIIDD